MSNRGIRLTKEERKDLLAQLERQSSRTVPPERVLQRGEQALKDGRLEQARRILQQLETSAGAPAGFDSFRRRFEAAERSEKLQSNLQATEEMLVRYIQLRQKSLAALALETLVDLAPNHPRRADYETWVADLDRELELQQKVQRRLEVGQEALRQGNLALAKKHLGTLRKLDSDGAAAEQLAVDLASVAQGQAESAGLAHAKQEFNRLLAGGQLEEAERQMERLGQMDIPKVTIELLRKRLEEVRRVMRERAEAEELVAVFDRYLAACDWPNARETAQRFGQRFASSTRSAELFNRVNELEAVQRRQQSVDEGLSVLERFIAEGNRHDAELALKLLARLDLDPGQLAQLEARVHQL